MRTPIKLASVGATLALAASANAQTFTNPGSITISTVAGNAVPYPSTISVTGVANPISDVNVTLNTFTHTWCSDLDVVLVGPTGAACILISDRAGSADLIGTYVFDDAAASNFPTAAPLTPGTYKPANTGAADTFPAPGPGALNQATPVLSVFNGTAANGTWNLYIVDQFNGDGGGVNGWSIGVVANDCLLALPHPWCITDVNNDNSVNVTDLLAVIAGWGQSGPPRPAADIAPGANGDCTVNVTDLLAVIGQWGACPLPTGACCPAGGGACTQVTQTACETAGGSFSGIGSACPPSCPVTPLNDNPGGAFVLAASALPAQTCNAGNSAGATLTSTIPSPPCTFGGAANFTRDVWWKYTVPSTPGIFGQILSLDTCSNVAPFTDTTLAAYTGTFPGTLTEVACNDDDCGSIGLNSRITTPLIPAGQTVYVRLGSWSTGATNQGAYNLCASFETITQDDCLGAETLAIGGSDTDTLLSATQDTAPTCSTISAGIGKWYKLTGNGQTVTVSTCTSTPDIYDGSISVYCAGTFGCAGLNCVVATNADQGTPQLPSCPAFQGESATFCTGAGSTYYILVSVAGAGLPTGINGSYTVTAVANGISCTNTIDCNAGSPPANDECATAQVVTVGNTSFSNVLAGPATGTGTMCGQPWSKDVWFNYTSANGGTVTVTITSTPNYDSVIEIYNGAGCAPLGPAVGCVDDAPTCVGCHGTVTFTATAGTTYKIRCASWSTSGGGFGNLVITDP